MRQYDKITPEGTRDYLFDECDVRRDISKKVSGIFENHGYNQVSTPGLEFYDVFSSNSRSYPQESMYKLVDQNGRLLVLRPDCTTPIARMVTTKLKNSKPPFRLYYDQNVYRMTRSLSGRSDEIKQIGAELIGSNHDAGDLEVISMAQEALELLGIKDYRLEIGHIGFFNAMISKLETSKEVKDEIRECIITKNYPALNDLLLNLPKTDAVKALEQLPRLFGGVEVFDQAKTVFADQVSQDILDYLRKIYLKLCRMGLKENLIVDLGLVNENIYYTGVVFRAYMIGSGEAVLSGGRYDKLFEDFGMELDATGFGMDVNILAKVLLESGRYETVKPAEVLIIFEEDYAPEAVVYARQLSIQGVKSELAFGIDIQEAVQLAQQKGIRNIRRVSKEIVEISVDREGELKWDL